MKRKLLLLSASILFIFNASSQVNIVYGSPATNGSTTGLRGPNGEVNHTTLRAHMIIPASDIVGLTNGDVITTIGFSYAAGTAGTASGNIQFYLENSADMTNLKSTAWATAISSMTNVYNGVITLPSTASASNVDLGVSNSFTYTGGGIYVAYDYVGASFSTGPANYNANNLLPGALKMDITSAMPAADTLTLSSGFRPEIRLGIANPNSNDMVMNDIRPSFGQVDKTLVTTTNATGIVTNASNTALSNVAVTLDITGANTYSSVETIASIAPGETLLVSFSGIPTMNSGTNMYALSVGNDDENSNNLITSTQGVSCGKTSYAPISPISGSLGYNQGDGIFAIALDVPASSLPIYVKKVMPTISNNVNSVGNTIKGVLLNSAGVIVDSTALYTITSGDAGAQVDLTFINGTVDYSGQSLFVGFRQTANTTTGYYPLATADQLIVFSNLYYTISSNGGTASPQTTFGAFLIDAELDFGVDVVLNNVTLTTSTTTAGMTYQWKDCGTGLDISGETGMSYTATSAILTGDYAVDATLNGCSSSSICTVISFVSVDESSDLELSLFPNPAVNILNISTNLNELTSYSIFDIEGKIVLSSKINNNSSLEININNLEAGTYFLELNSKESTSTRKIFVKQ